jgi:type VI secretion system protein ImpL
MTRTDRQVHLRAALIAIGLYGAAALVWFVGPLLSVGGFAPLASERARGIAIAVVLAIFAAQALWRAQRGARRNRQLLDGLAAGAADEPLAAGASEVALIGKRFADAVAVLRERRVGPRSAASFLRRRPFVYELPWYVLIGAPGAGKTTTIVNSGLHFPLADAQGGARAVAGVGGTRHCDWWFTDEAVLIDTAGRYTTQDSYREADRAAWNGFLAQLVQHRPRQPINGVILTLSVTDLLQPNAERRAALAREMRARIDELHQRLAIRFPIYLLVTKSDLLAGFAEFFADFDKDERAQVWGTTLPLDGGGADAAARLSLLAGELNALEKTLNEQLFDRLRDEHDRERRAAIFGFPQQWRLLRDALVEMLQATFAPTADGGPAMLRGVYFTSATQEGSPVDRALGGLARAMGLAHRVLPAARGSGRSYFVTRLLREVIIGEAGVAGTNRLWERRRARLHGLTVAASLLLALGVTALAWQREAAARIWLGDAAREVQALRTNATTVRTSGAGELAPLVPLLGAVADLAQRTRADAAARPAWASMGLDARVPVAAVAQDVYHHLLRETLLPRIASRLEGRLTARGAEQVDTLYEALKAYLMLFGGRHVDAEALRGYLLAERDGALPSAYRGPLRVHLDRLLATGEVGAPSQADAALVARVRERVVAVPMVERVVQRLRQSRPADAPAAPGLEQLAGPAAGKLLQRASGVPLAEPVRLGLAARVDDLQARLQQALRQFELEAPWVLAGTQWQALDDGARARLAEQVRARHRAEVQQGWLELLADLRIYTANGGRLPLDLTDARYRRPYLPSTNSWPAVPLSV